MSWNIIDKISRYVSKEARSRTSTGKVYESVAYGTGTSKLYEVTSSATANTFGDYVEIEDSLSAESELCGFMLAAISSASNTGYVIEFASGAAGSEVPFFRMSGYTSISARDGTNYEFASNFAYTFKKSFVFPAGTRIAVRMSDGVASALAHYVSMQWYQGLEAI
jgi:hypothetical protein